MSQSVIGPLRETLFSGFIGQGAKVDEFERRLAEYLGTPFVVTVNSGTAALHLAYRLAGIGQGSEVISTPMSCQATNQPLLERGARITWADVDPHTGNIDPVDVWRKVTPETRAIVAVHWGGYPCDLDRLADIADECGASLIEDAAHAFGSEYKGQKIGSLGGRFQCFSFQAIKTLTTVDGGLLVCHNEADYKRAKLLRWYGMDREDKTRLEMRCEADVVEHGYKAHMNDVNATIGIENLKSVPERLARARMNAAYYDAELRRREINLVRAVRRDVRNLSSCWLFHVLVDDPARFIPFMKSRGVHASQVHVRNDVHTLFAASRASLPGVDLFAAHQCSIPVGAWVTEADRETVMDAIEAYDSI